MPHPVFISYARDASRAQARAIHDALGGAAGRVCFLDEQDIGVGEAFPERLVDALFDARVVVILAEPLYFTRRYCLQEFHLASGPFSRLLEHRPNATDAEKAEMLRGIVVALPERDVDPMLDRFPSRVAGRNWPRADDADAVAAMVRAELAADPPTLRERYAEFGADAAERARFLAKSALPTPLRIGSIPMAPTLGIPVSIGDAFVGRADDMWRIHDVLTTRRGDLRTAAGITGSIEAGGGFGKTRIAVEYLYRFGTRNFQGGLFWIDAEQDPEDRLYEILVALNPGANPMDEVRKRPGGVAAAVARAIRSLPRDSPPPLFIIDNVPEPGPGESPKPLEFWCPVPGEVSVLTTSRTQVALGGGAVKAVRIDVLDPESAIELVSSGVGGLSRSEWGEIARWVGFLPLALELVNRATMARAVPVATWLAASRAAGATMKPLDDAMTAVRIAVPNQALRGITDAFLISYRRLGADQQRAVRLLAWMAPAPIPLAVLDAFGAGLFEPQVRVSLHTRAFVSEVASGDGTYFGMMHRVLADFLVGQAVSPEEEARSVAGALLHSLWGVRGNGDAGAAHARRSAAAIVTALDRFLAMPPTPAWTQLIVEFGGDAASALMQDWMASADAEAIQQRAVHAAETRLGVDDILTVNAMGNMAAIQRARGKLDRAAEIQKQVVEIGRRVAGYGHPGTLMSLNNLANTLHLLGDYAQAQRLLEFALNGLLQAVGQNDSRTITVLTNLGAVLGTKGDLENAQRYQEAAVEASRQASGDEHADTLAAMNNLAVTLRLRGDLAGAHELHERVLAARERILGEEHPETLSSMTNLANAHSERGNLVEAQKLQRRALDILRRVLGDAHPDTLLAMHNLGGVLFEQGNLDEAEALFDFVLEQRRRLVGEEHPDTLSAVGSVAGLRYARHDYDGAEALMNGVMEALKRTQGMEHPHALRLMGNMASLRRIQGDLSGARKLLEEVRAVQLRVLGTRHPDTTRTAWNLLLTLSALEDWTALDDVLTHDLGWLVEDAPDALPDSQLQVRDALLHLVQRSGSGNDPLDSADGGSE